MRRYLICLVALGILSHYACAQTGAPPFASFTKGQFDAVNNGSANVIFGIPIVSSPGRGLSLDFSAVYNSQVYSPQYNAGGTLAWTLLGGWLLNSPVGMVFFQEQTTYGQCGRLGSGYTQTYIYTNYQYVDPLGTFHPLGNLYLKDVYSSCTGTDTYTGTFSSYASDQSGFYASINNPALSVIPTLINKAGVAISTSAMTIKDANGNFLSGAIVSGSETDWTDSVGRVALKIITSGTTIQYKFLDPTGSYQTTTVNMTSLPIKTNFGCANIIEYSATQGMPTSLVLPNGQTYQFSYEPTPGNSGYYTGRVQRVTLPTGGYYEYDYTGANDGINCADGTTLGLNQVTSDGTNTATWKYVRTTASTTITTPQLADTPNAFDTVYSFTSGHLATAKIYKESPGVNVLRTINTTWAANNTPATQVTILEDGSTQSETDTTFDSNGLLDSVSEYDFGSGTHGALIRTTTYTYQTSTNYTSRNIINLVATKAVKDGSGTVQYRQDTTYDGVSLANCPTGVPQHDDTNYGCTFNYRGNPSAVTTYLTPATPANGVTKNFTFDFFGNLLTAQLNCCQQKIWTYSATTKYASPDSITSGTSPTQLTTSATYNSYTGLMATTTDENNQVTNFYYDILRRPTSIVRQADNATVTYAYDDVHFTTTVKSPIDSTKSVQQVSALDSLGRTATSTTEDGSSNVISIVSSQYNLAGRVYKASNPYTGSPSYWTVSQFDVLGRPIKETLPDNSATNYAYSVNTTTVTDPAGKQRKSVADAAGRLSSVYEPDPANGNSLTVQTSYAYNVLDGLTQVTEGAQTRSYSFDALGRLLSSTTPEAGRVCFGSVTSGTCHTDGYDSFDNLLKRTDARGVLTSYGYDGLNRLGTITYNVGTTGVPATASVSLTYGTNSAQFNNGRLITMTDGVGSENYSYNNLGLMTQVQKTVSSTIYTTSYQYNTAGEVTQLTYPSGHVVQQSVDAIGRLCEVAPSTSGCGTAGSPFATGFAYNVAGQVIGFKYGNNIYASYGYSSDRLQLTCLDYSTTNRGISCAHDATTKFGLTYSYGTTGSNDGLFSGITDSVDNGRTTTYTFDALSRMSTAVTVGSTAYPRWGLSMVYDRYGNRTQQQVTAGSGVPSSCLAIDTNNHVTGTCGSSTGFNTDLNGNQTGDGINTLTYDAENRIVSAASGSGSGTYTYDGNGQRVKKVSGSTTTVTIFLGSQVLAEYVNGAAPTAPTNEYIYAGDQRIVSVQSGTTNYWHNDHLSPRVRTTTTGSIADQRGTYPYGETWYSPGQSPYMFTTYYRDYESGNDYAQARYDITGFGRFLSPDPIVGSTIDPQSLNRYSYVRNMPVIFSDAAGTCPPTVQNFDDDSQSGEFHGGPSMSSLDISDPQPQAQPCPGTFFNSYLSGGGGWWGGGFFLDGGDITDNSGSSSMGFSLGSSGHGIPGTISQPIAAWSGEFVLGNDSHGPGLLLTGFVDWTSDFSVGQAGSRGGSAQDKISRGGLIANLLLSDPDCAAFLKSILTQAGYLPNLDNYRAILNSLNYIPAPPNVKPGYPGVVAQVRNGTDTVQVFRPNDPQLGEVFLHETFHTNAFGITDAGLALYAAGGYAKAGINGMTQQQADIFNSKAASKAFYEHCNTNKVKP